VPKVDDETRWFDKAEETIKAAKEMKDTAAKTSLLAIAKGYMQLAKHCREQSELRRKSKILN
jgi:hypothetical protein